MMASRLADDGKQAGRRRRAGWQAGKQLQAGEQAGNCRLAEAGTWLATQATAEQAGCWLAGRSKQRGQPRAGGSTGGAGMLFS